MMLREGVDTKAFWDIFFHPACKAGILALIIFDGQSKAVLCALQIWCGKDIFERSSYLKSLRLRRGLALCVLRKMELAALPGHRAKDGLPCDFHACMVIRDNQEDTA